MLGCLRSLARAFAAHACRPNNNALLQSRGTCSRALVPRLPLAEKRLPAGLSSQFSTPRVLDHALKMPVKPLTPAQTSQLVWHSNRCGFVSHLGVVAFTYPLSTTAAASQNGSTAAEAAQAAEDVLVFYKDTPRREDHKMSPVERAYWEDILKTCRKVLSIANILKLDMRWRLGLNPTFKAKQRPNCFDIMIRGKIRHPDAVVLVQVGSFYECAGIDAIILAEWCGLNFMGTGTPKAGLPLDNVHMVLGQLRERGLQVALYEEVGDMPGSNAKYRKFTQLVNAENPFYLYNYAEGSRDLDMVAPAICGLSITSRGFTVMQYSPLTSSIVVYEGLTLDAAWGYCSMDRSTTPVVYMHRPHDATSQQLKQLADVQKRFAPNTVHWRAFTAYDAEEGFTGEVLKNKGLPADTHLEVKRRDWSAGISGVRPLYASTAVQLGLLQAGAGGLPSLLDDLLPAGARKINRDALLNLLICPPPYFVAKSVRDALTLLMASNTPLPAFCERGLTPSKLLMLLDAKEGNALFFQNLSDDLRAVAKVLRANRTPEAAALVKKAWPLLLHTTNQPQDGLSQDQVLEAVEAALRAIKYTVAPASMSRGMRSSSGGADNSADDEESGAASKRTTKSKKAALQYNFTAGDAETQADAVFEQLHPKVVRWTERVRANPLPAAMSGVLKEWSDATDHLEAVLGALVWTAHSAAKGTVALNQDNQPFLEYNSKADNHSAICLRLPDESVKKALAGPLQLQAPGNGMQLDLPLQQLRKVVAKKKTSTKADSFTCDALEQALVDFHDVTSRANSEATSVLKKLAADLSMHKVELHAALTLGVLLSTLAEHSRAASAAGWTLPLVGASDQKEAGVLQQPQPGSSSSSSSSGVVGGAVHDGVLQLRQLWPYWMSGSDTSTVKNDISGNTMMLLTGPNMAGKSTVLRSVAAAALAGSVGLAIPAERGSCLPLLDAIILRTFSGDAPQEGLSAYGVEMTEMATVVADAQPSSLVLIDELGKGTEVVSGTALAAGILQDLAQRGVMGVFATHLHLLVPMLAKAQVPNIEPYRMEVVARDTPGAGVAGGGPAAGSSCPHLYQLKPTWRLLPGHCFESLAFSVARDCGLPQGVLRASEDYYSMIMQGGHMSGAAYDLIVAVAQAANSSSSSNFSSIDISSSTTDVSGTVAAAAVAGSSGSESWSDGDSSGDEIGEGAAAPADAPEQATATDKRPGRFQQLVFGEPGDSSDDDNSSSSSSEYDAVPYDLDAARVSAHKLFEQMRPLLLDPSPAAEAALDTAAAAAAAPNSAAAADAEAGAGAGSRRRWRKGTSVQQAPQQQQQQQSGPSDTGAVEYGVVRELLPGMMPPALHEGQSVLYVVYDQDAWWYGGETQEVRNRLKAHRKAKRFAQPITMWYVVLHPSVDRKGVEGWMIREAERMGMRLRSNHDARNPSKK